MKVRDKWRIAIMIVITSAAVFAFRQHALSVYQHQNHKCSSKEPECPKVPGNGKEGSVQGGEGSIIWNSLSDHLL
ncbi:hypothetical protein [Flavihumibacter solisilvae]|uniref:Uncharacterized protein n=1 Tax=Flavihumibacter solisilvae TaxID=1349421 RepID=A0A0C1L3W6_9BACT|nr:hypothetical protein [Flavihumibacter solisilvae]KIC94727.1 hypothetical protein OI18_09585 [Flavihumibacter solisilvae]